ASPPKLRSAGVLLRSTRAAALRYVVVGGSAPAPTGKARLGPHIGYRGPAKASPRPAGEAVGAPHRLSGLRHGFAPPQPAKAGLGPPPWFWGPGLSHPLKW